MPRDPRQHQHYDARRGRILRPRERTTEQGNAGGDLFGTAGEREVSERNARAGTRTITASRGSGVDRG